MERHTEQTLATLRENLRLTREVRQAALERGNRDVVAVEDEAILRLERHIARIEATAAWRESRATGESASAPARQSGRQTG